MATSAVAKLDIPVEPKAGKFGTFAVFIFGVASILVVFVAAYMWTTEDTQLAAAVGVAAIAIPTTVGFFVSELRHQRSGAFWFVVAAAIVIGGSAAYIYDERDAFEDRRNFIAPGVSQQLVPLDEAPLPQSSE